MMKHEKQKQIPDSGTRKGFFALDYHYKAFISYRHFTPDQEIAKKLHTYIENYAVPPKLKKKLGIRRMGRVFRDQEELPLSSNLGDDIHAALEQSEWLICICSPRYLESRWCMEELRYFLSMGRRDHVLTLLADGEPDTAFPEALRFIETDGKTEAVEPLAADVRADSLPEMLKKLKGEKLRILAPMLEVAYDDLRQRARQRRVRQAAAAGAAAILLLGGFLGYSLWKNAEITGERNRTMIAQSRFLANESGLILERRGDRMLAMMLAREALPADCSHPDRPVTDEALCALRSSLVSGLNADRYVTVTDFDLPVRAFASDGERLAVLSDEAEGYLTCFRLENGAEEAYPLKLKKRPHLLRFSADLQEVLCADPDGVHRLSTDGTGIRTADYDIFFSERADSFAVSEGWNSIAFTNSNYSLSMLPPGSEQFITLEPDYISSLSPVLSGGNDSKGSPDGKYLTWFPGVPGSGDLVMLKAAGNAETVDDLVLHRYFIAGDPAPEVKEQFKNVIHRYTSSFDGSIVFGMAERVLYYWDAYTEEQLGAVTADVFGDSGLEEIIACSSKSLIAVVTGKGQLFVYDYSNGHAEKMDSESFRIHSAVFSPDGSRMLCADTENRTALVFHTQTGMLLQSVTADFELTGAYFARQDPRGNALDDRYILLTGTEKSRLLTTDEARTPEMIRTMPAGPVSGRTKSVLSPDGTETWFLTQTQDHSRLNVYNFATGEHTVVREYRDGKEFINCSNLSRIGDRYAALSGEEYGTDRAVICLYDFRTHEPVRTLYPDLTDTIGLRMAYQNRDYAVFRNFNTNQGKYTVLDAATGEIVYSDGNIPMDDYQFRIEGHYLFVLNDRGRLACPPVNLASPPRETTYNKEWFHGIFDSTGIPGFSGKIAVRQAGEQTCILETETGKETFLDLKAAGEAFLSADRKGLILKADTEKDAYFLYNGSGLIPYEPTWTEVHPAPEPSREYMYDGRWVYLLNGALYDSETGIKQIDFLDTEILVEDTAGDGSVLLIRNEGKSSLWQVRCPDGNTLLRMADGILRERELSTEERKQYFIE